MLWQLLLSLLRALFGTRREPTAPPTEPSVPPPEPVSPPEPEEPRQPVAPEPPSPPVLPPSPELEVPQPTPPAEPIAPPQPVEPPEPERPQPGPTPEPSPTEPQAPPSAKTIVPLLVFPGLTGDEAFNQLVEVANGRFYTSGPWEVDESKVNQAIRSAEDWLADALGRRIPWEPVRVINSQKSLTEWRNGQINLIRSEVERLGFPWSDDYIYLAFVRGMGGYAGGISYRNGDAGYAMVGDICLEAICEYAPPTAGSVLLGDQGWPANSYSLVGQTGALIHEALHGLDLPHPDGWPADDQPQWDETLMGHWWNMPNFANTRGLTRREVRRVLRWTGSGP